MGTYTFPWITRSQVMRFKCCDCGKSRTKVIKVQQTANPFNRNPETGLPKTPMEVAADVKRELQGKVAAFHTNRQSCTTCLGRTQEVK